MIVVALLFAVITQSTPAKQPQPDFMKVPLFASCDALQTAHMKRVEEGNYLIGRLFYRPITNLIEPPSVRPGFDLSVKYVLIYVPVVVWQPCIGR